MLIALSSLSYLSASLVFRPFPFGLKVLGFQRDMANLSNKCGKKPVLVFIIDPRNKTRAVDTLISNIETLLAAKGEGLFRYTLRVELFDPGIKVNGNSLNIR